MEANKTMELDADGLDPTESTMASLVTIASNLSFNNYTTLVVTSSSALDEQMTATDLQSMEPGSARGDHPCTLFGDDQSWRCDILLTIRRISATFSLVGCLGIITIIWLFRKYQFFSQRLILFTSVSGVFVSIGYWLGDIYSDGPICNLEGFYLTLSEWSVLLWVTCITFNIFINAVKVKNTESYEWAYHMIGWSVPFLVSIVPLFGDFYGLESTWCWIPKQYPQWRLGIWYLPSICLVGLQFLILLIVTFATRRRVKKWEGTYNPELERAKKVIKDEVKPLSMFPVLYLFTSIMPVINRLHNALNPEDPSFSLYLMQNLMAPIFGFLTAVHYAWERDTRARLTWVQIKAAWQSNTNHQSVVREYPIMYRMEDKVCKGENQVIEFLRYDHVEYKKLQGAACKSQSCLEE